jgi:hypothetical protein
VPGITALEENRDALRVRAERTESDLDAIMLTLARARGPS